MLLSQNLQHASEIFGLHAYAVEAHLRDPDTSDRTLDTKIERPDGDASGDDESSATPSIVEKEEMTTTYDGSRFVIDRLNLARVSEDEDIAGWIPRLFELLRWRSTSTCCPKTGRLAPWPLLLR